MTTVALVTEASAVPTGDPSTWVHQCGEPVQKVEGSANVYFCVKCLKTGEPQEWRG